MISPETIEQIKALMQEASVFEEDLDESFILGGGPGGQKTNKTSNVVRLSHEPSALSVRCGETRSRETNRWLARRMLAEMILDRERKRKSSARQAAELMTSVAADGETVPYAARLDVPPMTALEVREGAAITVRGSLCIGGLWLDAGARLNGSGKVMIEPNGSVKFRTLDTISPGIGFVAPKGYSVVTNLTASSPNISVICLSSSTPRAWMRIVIGIFLFLSMAT